mmetsp:Transcript_40610/g.39203  ORF Transcript_40610/g.39203 Transcript_40610/m.39203 type:complete len:275 (+) Transcript_40610:634-1458(+)
MGLEQYYLYIYQYQLDYLKRYPATHPSQDYFYQQTLMAVEHELASWEHKAELMEAQFQFQQEISMAPYYEQEMLRYQYGMELATMYKEYVQAEVTRVLTRMESSRYTSKQNVTDMLTSAAQAVGCNVDCVGSCSNASWTIQEAGTCLDKCYCYTAPPAKFQYPAGYSYGYAGYGSAGSQAPAESSYSLGGASAGYYGAARPQWSYSQWAYEDAVAQAVAQQTTTSYFAFFGSLVESGYKNAVYLGAFATVTALGAALFLRRGPKDRDGIYEALL